MCELMGCWVKEGWPAQANQKHIGLQQIFKKIVLDLFGRSSHFPFDGKL